MVIRKRRFLDVRRQGSNSSLARNRLGFPAGAATCEAPGYGRGPLLLACIFFAATLTDRIVPGRLWDALPVFLLLAAWAIIGIKRRLRQAADLQQSIDEITTYH